MNTTEQIVESYYRICKECFTVPDVKVHGGYGRQLDLLAYCLREKEQYHIEIQVSHMREFALSVKEMFDRFDSKFLGVLNERERNSPNSKKSYLTNINRAYRWFGFNPTQVNRVWVCWELPKDKKFLQRLENYNSERELDENPITVVSFREVIIPQLKKRVKTAHYDDVSLRTISLIMQSQIQGNIDREKGRQGKLPQE